MDDSKVLIVMPALNEEESVGFVVKETLATLPRADVVVVDDGSHDRTAEMARAAGATVLRLSFQLGVGGAIRTGLRYAALHDYAAAVQVDADGQHDPKEIKLLLEGLEWLGEPEIVIGSRFAGRGSFDVKGPRKWAMRLLAASLSRIAGTTLTDVTSGFRCYNRPAIELLERSYPAEYLADTIDSLVMARRAGTRIAEVPVAMRPRKAGTPSQSVWKSTVYLFRALFALLLSLIRR